MRTSVSKSVVTASVLAILCAIAWWAWSSRQKPTGFEKVAADFVKFSLSDDDAVTQMMVVTRETWSSTASWELDTKREWKAYTSWLSTKLGPDFRKTVEEDCVIELRKTLPGEIHIIRCECGPADQPQRVRLSLIVMPW